MAEQIASDNQLREAYAQCEGNWNGVARLLGYSVKENGGINGNLRARLRKLGLQPQGRKGPKPLIDQERLAEFRSAGMSQAELQFIFQVARSTIQRSLAQLGLTGAA